jgi:hypothetical protein
MKQPLAHRIDEDLARAVATIASPGSAYAKALAELDAGRAQGKDLSLVTTPDGLAVVATRALAHPKTLYGRLKTQPRAAR